MTPEEMKKLLAEAEEAERKLEEIREQDRKNFVRQMILKGKIKPDLADLAEKILKNCEDLDRNTNGGAKFYEDGSPINHTNEFKRYIGNFPAGFYETQGHA